MTIELKRRSFFALFLLFSIAAFVGGCTCRGPRGSPIGAGAELFPPDLQSQPVKLSLGGIVMDEAIMQVESLGSRRTLLIRNQDVTIDKEVYEVDSDGISLVELGSGSGAGDQFEPPLILMKFPALEGQKIEWKGSIRFGNVRAVTAEATSSTETELLSMATGSAQTIRVTVDLRLESGAPEQAKRRLEFWFVNGLGPVKRDFGANQIREPRLRKEEKAQSEG